MLIYLKNKQLDNLTKSFSNDNNVNEFQRTNKESYATQYEYQPPRTPYREDK